MFKPVTRRGFNQITALSGILAGTGLRAGYAAEDERLPIVDTHQHLWDLKDFQPPWLDGADARITGKHDTADYIAATSGLNVVKAVYMEIDVAPEDQRKEADFILSLIATGETPTVAAVISGRPNSQSFGAAMENFRENPLIKGVRQVLHASTAQRGLCVQPQFVKSIRLLGEMGKTFDLCMRPAELSDGARLVEQCPDTRFIVDHCGNADPKVWRAQEQSAAPAHTVDQWKRDIETLASFPNVICKISGIVAAAPADWTPDDLAPAVDHCLDQFGPKRVVFGGDWPVCKLGASYAQWVDALRQIVSIRPRDEQLRLFHDNAVEFYGLG